MGGMKASFDREAWEAMSDSHRLGYVKEWILVEVDGRRVKAIAVSKEFAEKMTVKDKESLEKRGIEVHINSDELQMDSLYEPNPDEKKKVKKNKPDIAQIAKELGMEIRSIRKTDYDSMTPEQRSAHSGFKTDIYTFHGTDDLIPESQEIVYAHLSDLRRLEEMEKRRVPLLSMNEWVLSLFSE